MPVSESPRKKPRQSQENRHLLVVEDDAANREILVSAFEAEGFEVASAGRGNDALLAARRTHPLGVVLDLLLPDLDASTIVEGLRKSGGDFALVLVSASTDLPHMAGVLNADAYFPKPYDLPDVVAAVERLVPQPAGTNGVP
jgi:DNA-binding response OmpR family regulator